MTTAILVLARTLHIGSAMVLFAIPWFLLVILRPAFGAGKVPFSFCQKMTRWLWVALILEAVSGGIWFWLVAAQMSDLSPWEILVPSNLIIVLEQTQFGQLWMERALLGAALGVALSFTSCKTTPISNLHWLVLALSGFLLISLAWAGHAAAGIHHHILHLFADTLHLLLGAIWPMGLIPLACFLWQSENANPTPPSQSEIQALQKFSQTSLMVVVVLLATGVINGWLMLDSWTALVTTTYGRLLLGKVAVVGIMIGFGAVNRFCFLPRLQIEQASLSSLRKTVLTESCLILIILLIVGMMGMTSPPTRH